MHVSMVGFDDGSETERELDGAAGASDQRRPDRARRPDHGAARCRRTQGICFHGRHEGRAVRHRRRAWRARCWRAAEPERPAELATSCDPWVNGAGHHRRPRGMWIIDFGVDMPMEEAALYEMPFEYVKQHVKPVRDRQRRASLRESSGGCMREPRPEMRQALSRTRHATSPRPTVSKHRLFVWLDHRRAARSPAASSSPATTTTSSACCTRSLHELWALRMGTQLREAESGSRYTPTTTFETFPFPWPPGQEPAGRPARRGHRRGRAASWSRSATRWLNPPGASEAELKKRTLTNLYNQRPTWLRPGPPASWTRRCCDAYGWPHDLSDEEILARLLALTWSGQAPRQVTGRRQQQPGCTE